MYFFKVLAAQQPALDSADAPRLKKIEDDLGSTKFIAILTTALKEKKDPFYTRNTEAIRKILQDRIAVERTKLQEKQAHFELLSTEPEVYLPTRTRPSEYLVVQEAVPEMREVLQWVPEGGDYTSRFEPTGNIVMETHTTHVERRESVTEEGKQMLARLQSTIATDQNVIDNLTSLLELLPKPHK